jgi:hypothetical protein
MPFGFIKTEVNLPQEYATAVDIGYPVDAFWFYQNGGQSASGICYSSR